jgi:hypothetical protein
MELRLKRLLPRKFIDWQGKYMIENDPDECWRDCRVIDVTTFGAGLELVDVTLDKTAGRSIILSDNLRGQVRHTLPAKNDGIRVGIEFVNLTEIEQSYLTSLANLQAVW